MRHHISRVLATTFALAKSSCDSYLVHEQGRVMQFRAPAENRRIFRMFAAFVP